jgi:hypothetical protein
LRHRKILNAAAFAANVAAGREHPDGPEMAPLYDYCRARGFPPPETLARKFGEMQGQPFPYVSLAEAPEGINVFFTTFRAVAQALEPFREEDEADEIVAGIIGMIDATEQDEEETAMAGQPRPDDVKSRTEAAQEAMDAAIAESGGTFEEVGDAKGTDQGQTEDQAAEMAEPDRMAAVSGGEPDASAPHFLAEEGVGLETAPPDAGSDAAQPPAAAQRGSETEPKKKRK